MVKDSFFLSTGLGESREASRGDLGEVKRGACPGLMIADDGGFEVVAD